MRIGVRIFLGYFLVVGLAAFFLLDTAHDKLEPALRQSMEDTLVDTANLLAEFVQPELQAGTIVSGQFAQKLEAFAARRLNAKIWGVPKDRPNHRIYVTDALGVVLYDSDHLALGQDYSRWNDVYRTLRGQYGARTTRGDPDDPETSVMYVAAPVYGDGSKLIGVVTVAKPSRSVEPFFAQAFGSLARAAVIVLVVGLLIGLLLSWWLTRSLSRLVSYASAVGRGERVVLPELGGGEVGLLGHALDSMRSQLEGKQYVEHYVHSLTHELKSPLAAIRGAAELIEPDMPFEQQTRFLGNIRRESQRMTEIIERLLELARLESRTSLQALDDIAVGDLLSAVVEAKAGQAAACGVVLKQQADAGLTLRGERFLLSQALSNLLDNALAFSPTGTTIELSAERRDAAVVLSVRDHGPGLPDYALPRVFERFYSLPRPDGTPKSTGLGLPFVREVASLHGGDIQLANHPEGGALAQLSLPD
ncbi:two-component system sensor histidine kinase CreC [Chitinimonas sp. BJB300]|uniref:two-component system sensor histidine kinase CreC n=1 Tax=Chitinimonas sp. BJB300 TaxID=1559339 RepID=UPI000C0E1380|nr:two-component system sensor histidine kinase CreC [Chitinimonas sp. BJB300]PHV10366.1 two-component system sensor histidine kinase CreC [Chitinimonas sp. BJB300]TSJ91038.1 two-component system sensor histidine kinase CreC [Chitinimonas sp. BJB300]